MRPLGAGALACRCPKPFRRRLREIARDLIPRVAIWTCQSVIKGGAVYALGPRYPAICQGFEASSATIRGWTTERRSRVLCRKIDQNRSTCRVSRRIVAETTWWRRAGPNGLHGGFGKPSRWWTRGWMPCLSQVRTSSASCLPWLVSVMQALFLVVASEPDCAAMRVTDWSW